MNRIDNLEQQLGMRKHTIAFLVAILTALGVLIGVLGIMQNGKVQQQNIDAQYDINIINKLAQQDLEEKRKEQNLPLSFPLDFQFDNNDFVINCSTYDDEYNSRTNTSISGYKLGEVRFSNTKEGVIVLETIRNRMNVFLEKDANTMIKVVAYGSADGTPVKSGLKYNGEFGYHTKKIKYYKDNNANKPLYKEFIIGQTPMTNTDFALLRAYDIVEYLTNRFSIGEKNIKIFTTEYDEIGEEYRRCDFSITLEKVLLLKEKDYEKLNWSGRQFVN